MNVKQVLLVLVVMSTWACTAENEEDLGIRQPGDISDDDTEIDYQTQVKPILTTNCTLSNCHDGSTSLPNFTLDQNVLDRLSSIQSEVESNSMPRGRTLSFEDKNTLLSWINQGGQI